MIWLIGWLITIIVVCHHWWFGIKRKWWPGGGVKSNTPELLDTEDLLLLVVIFCVGWPLGLSMELYEFFDNARARHLREMEVEEKKRLEAIAFLDQLIKENEEGDEHTTQN